MTDCGIYTITHLESGRAYVGSSVRIAARWRQHRNSLRKGRHHCPHLQRAWVKYGEAGFSFAVVEAAEPNALAERETAWIGKHRSGAGIYNLAPVGGSTRGLTLGPMPEERRRKISESHRGIRPDDAARAKMRDAAKQRPPVSEATRQKQAARMTGSKRKPLSPEHRAAVSAAHKGKTISAEHRAALSRAHKGRPLSEEHKRKKSEAAKRQHARQRAEREALRLPRASPE